MGRGDGAKGHQHAEVDGDGVVEEGTDNLLDEFCLGFGEGGRGVVWKGKLLILAVDRLIPFVRGVAGAEREEGRETVEGLGNIVGHGEVNVSVWTIAPVERHAQEFGACTVDCGCVQAVQGREEVFEVGSGGVFHPKIVDDEGKLYGVGGVAP